MCSTFYYFVGVLGIPYLDVVRVLAAVILLGNVQFVESPSCLDHDVEVKVKRTIKLIYSDLYTLMSSFYLKVGKCAHKIIFHKWLC